MYGLLIVVCPFVLFLLAIMLSVLLRTLLREAQRANQEWTTLGTQDTGGRQAKK